MTHYKISTDAQGLRWIAAVDALGDAHDLIMVMPYESVRAAAEDLLAASGGMISQEDRQALRALAADADQDPALTG